MNMIFKVAIDNIPAEAAHKPYIVAVVDQSVLSFSSAHDDFMEAMAASVDVSGMVIHNY